MTHRFSVSAEKTGANYPNYAFNIGLGWSFVLRDNGKFVGEFDTHTSAWAWADRLSSLFCN